MQNTVIKLCIGLTLAIGTASQANWGNSAGMMPFGGQGMSQQMQPFGGSMPWGGQSANQSRYQPRYNPYDRGYRGYNRGYQQAPQVQPFGGMGSSMPFGSMMQPQPQYQAPRSSSFMMPGMDQGIRTMMEPGKIMAEEATPGVYMKPTWR